MCSKGGFSSLLKLLGGGVSRQGLSWHERIQVDAQDRGGVMQASEWKELIQFNGNDARCSVKFQ